MDKKHISLWLNQDTLKQCEVNMRLTNCKTRSEYLEKAIEFYNAFLHSENNEKYISKIFISTLNGRLESTENRIANILYKQAVEISKLFHFLAMAFQMSPEDMDKIHYECVQEVKKINGAIKYPMKKQAGDD